MAKYRCLMIGAGGMARAWIRASWPNFFDRAEIVALVDVVPSVLNEQADFLDLPETARYSNMRDAFRSVEADFCTIVIPPEHHREAAVAAAEVGLDTLSEKPIADTWEDCLAIYEAATSAGIRMQIIQNYRATSRILTMKKVVEDGLVGRPNYVMMQFTADYRERGSWGMFRHEIAHSLPVEGAIHHFDQIRHIAGADCQTIAGWEWNPGHASFDGECTASFVMRMTDGVHAHYEGNCLAAGEQHPWYREVHRVEGDEGSVVLGGDHRVRLMARTAGGGLRTEEVTPVPVEWEAYNAMIAQFLDWLDAGGDLATSASAKPGTAIDDNIKSNAMMFGAIEASVNNCTVDVEAKAREAVTRAEKKAD